VSPYPEHFTRALAFVLEQEGMDSDHSADRGGRTRYGISQKAHPDVDVPGLTREGAAQIYYEHYWRRIWGDELPWPLSLVLFDQAVHSGAPSTVRALQRILGVQVDGIMGPITARAAKREDLRALLRPLIDQRLVQLCRQALEPLQQVFLVGWMRRIASLIWECA